MGSGAPASQAPGVGFGPRARLLGRERGIGRVGGEHAVHAGGHLAQAAQPREELGGLGQ